MLVPLLVGFLACDASLAQEQPPTATQRQTKLVVPQAQPEVQPALVAFPGALSAEEIVTAAFSADARTLAVAPLGGDVLVWDVAARHLRSRIRVDGPYAMAVSSDGSSLATIAFPRDGAAITVSDTRTGAELVQLPLDTQATGSRPSADDIRRTSVRMAFDAGGTRLAAAWAVGPYAAEVVAPFVGVWEVASGKQVARYSQTVGWRAKDVAGIVYGVDGGVLVGFVGALPTDCGRKELAEPGAGASIGVVVVPDRCTFSPDGSLLRIGGITYATDTGREVSSMPPMPDWKSWLRKREGEIALQIDDYVRPPGSRYLAVNYATAPANSPSRQERSLLVDLESREYRLLASPAVLFSPDGTLVVTETGVVNVGDGRVLLRLVGLVPDLCMFLDGDRVLATGVSGRCRDMARIGQPGELLGTSLRRAWDLGSGGASSWPDREETVRSCSASWLVLEDKDRYRVLSRSAQGKEAWLSRKAVSDLVATTADGAHRGYGTAFGIAANGEALYACAAFVCRGSGDQVTSATDLGVALQSLFPQQYTEECTVDALAFDPSGTMLAICLHNGDTLMWDVEKTTVVHRHTWPYSPPDGSIQFLADGRTAIISGGIGTRRVEYRDTETGVATVLPLEDAIQAYAGFLGVSATGRTLAINVEGPYTPGHVQIRRSDGAGGTSLVTTIAGVAVWGDLSPAGDRLALHRGSGLVELWALPTEGEEGEARLVAYLLDGADEAEWALALPSGFMTGTPGIAAQLAWRIGDALYPFQQFAGRYHRPDLVRRGLAGEDVAVAGGLTSADTPPAAAFLAPEYDAAIEGETAKVEVEVVGVRPLARVDLLIDGRPISDELAATAKWEQIEENHGIYTFELPLSQYQRRTRLQAIVHDEGGLQSMPAEVTFTRAGAPPRATVLHALSVGVSAYRNEEWNNLKYADRDAESFAKVAGEGAARKVLLNEDATGSNVRFALEEMKASVTEDDIVAIFLAGHGTVDAAGNYYMLLHDSDVADLDNTALPWDDFVAALKAIRAKLVMVFADTCHSGSITGQESVNTLIDRLNRKAGVVVFTASRGDEASIEREDWGHGAFTKALLEGFSGEADTYPKDEQVSLAELRDYVIQRVEELTSGRQHPYLPRLEEFDPARPICNVIPGAP